jgi:hypothetical protein
VLSAASFSASGTITATGNVSGGNLTTSGTVTGVNLVPSTDNTGVVGTSDLTWSNGQFTNLTVNGTLSVRAAIDLADSDVLRMGSSDDWKLYYNGTTNKGQIEMEAACLGIQFTNNGTEVAYLEKTSGNITGGNLITAGLVSLSSITKTGSNGVGNIGSSTSTFNTIFAKATSAQYADVAENYLADAEYPVGTVLEFGGATEITISTESHSSAVAGTVSDKPAYIMNSELTGEHVTTVALLGRVPCRVVGKISKGNLLVSSHIPGVATALDKSQWQPGCVFGKSLEDYDNDHEGVIEVVVGRF